MKTVRSYESIHDFAKACIFLSVNHCVQLISGGIRVLCWPLLSLSRGVSSQLLVCSPNRSQSLPNISDTIQSDSAQLCKDWMDFV